MFIGEISKQTGIPINTIRFYENQGVLDAPKRSESGYRVYGQEIVEKLLFIKKAQRFGLTLGEIRVIVQKSKRGVDPCCSHLKKLFDKKIGEFDEKIRELQRMKRDLKSLTRSWIPTKEAKARSYAICPQIESDHSPKKGRKKSGKKNR